MAVAGLVLALLIVLLSIAASVSAQGQGECLTHFSLNNPDFNTCRDRPCFIFIREEPNVNLDKDVMANLYAKRTLVFNCKDSDDISGLGGTAFEFIRRTAAKNAACV